jgi:hypothetical protein
MAAERVRDGFGADGLARARRPSEIERESKPGGMPFTEAQRLKIRSCCVTCANALSQGAPGRGRKNHIVEGSTRHDGVDHAAVARAKQTGK